MHACIFPSAYHKMIQPLVVKLLIKMGGGGMITKHRFALGECFSGTDMVRGHGIVSELF